MVLVEIVEKAAGADRMPRDLEIVNVPVPVRAHVVGRRHGQTISAPRTSRPTDGTCRMIRDLDRLTGQTFDVLVVGGGIYGLTIAYDAAQRGLSVALDRARRLRQRRLVQPSADDSRRAALSAVARHRPRARVGPRAAHDGADRAARGPAAALRPAALPIADARQAGDARRLRARSPRRRRIATAACLPSHRLPGGRVVSRSHAVQRFPGLRRQGLTGAAVFYDYVTTEPDRFTFSFALAAVEHGAVLANHVEAIAPLVDGRRVTGVSARDALGSRTFEIAARVTSTRPAAGSTGCSSRSASSTGIPMLKAMNLVTRRDAGDEALGGRTASGRNLFLVPWRERALFGTWESDRHLRSGRHRRRRARRRRVHRRAEPGVSGARSDAGRRHARPPRRRARGCPRRSRRARGARAGSRSRRAGVRRAAERGRHEVHDRARRRRAGHRHRCCRSCSTKPVPCRTATTPLPGGSLRDIGLAIADAQARVRRGAADRHDSASDRRVRLALPRRDGDRGQPSGLAHAARA